MDFFEEFTGKGSCVIILFKNNKILLQLRDEHAPTAANKWSFFGGGIDKGESPKEAIIRECKEEKVERFVYHKKDPFHNLS